MRFLILTMAAALSLAATPAGAQGANADGLKRLPGVNPLETSPLTRMQDGARAWIAAERARQALAPTGLVELAVNIDGNISEAIDKIARRERIGNGDLIMVVLYEIVAGAHDDVEAELERRRGAGADAAEIQGLTARKAVLEANLAEVIADQTVISRSLVPELAWSKR